MKFKIYLVGNPLVSADRLPDVLISQLKQAFLGAEIEEVDPNENFVPEKNSVIIDTVKGIREPTWFTSLQNFTESKKISPHDYDLYFHLRLLEKVNKLPQIRILGIPQFGGVALVPKCIALLKQYRDEFAT